MAFRTIQWKNNKVVILDQRLLPEKERYITCQDAEEVAQAIESLAIRGAPAIGVAAALGLALGVQSIRSKSMAVFTRGFEALCRRFASTRPTARNLFWAIERMKGVVHQERRRTIEEIQYALQDEAKAILREDIEANKKLGLYGQKFIRNGAQVLTYCNACLLYTSDAADE